MVLFSLLSLSSLILAYPVYILWKDRQDQVRKEKEAKEEKKRLEDSKLGNKLASEIYEVLKFLGEDNNPLYYDRYNNDIRGYALNSGLFSTYTSIEIKLDKAERYLLELRARAFLDAKKRLDKILAMQPKTQPAEESKKNKRRAAK